MDYKVFLSNGNLLEENPYNSEVILEIYKNELEDILRIALRNDCDVLIRKCEEQTEE